MGFSRWNEKRRETKIKDAFSERHFKWFCEINIKNNCGRQSVRFNEFTRTATIVEFRKCVLFFWFVRWVRCYAKSLVTRQNEFLFSPSFIIIFGLVLSRYLRQVIDFAEFKGGNTYVPLIYFSRLSNKNSNWTYAQQTIPTKINFSLDSDFRFPILWSVKRTMWRHAKHCSDGHDVRPLAILVCVWTISPVRGVMV